MGKLVPFSIKDFSGGISTIVRNVPTSLAQSVTGFDIYTDPHKLAPVPDWESGDTAASTSKKQNFAVAYDNSNWHLYALGQKSSTTRYQVLRKALTVNSSSDLSDNGWSAPSNNEPTTDPGSTATYATFVYYKRVDRIFFFANAQYIIGFSPLGSALSDPAQTLGSSFSRTAQGLVHSQDDVLYMPYDNKIASNNNGTWNQTALTLPSDLYITSIAEYGAYLAIAAAPLNGIGNSRVFIWDRQSTLNTVTQNIDWGTGTLQVLESIEGTLVGISVDTGSQKLDDKIYFRYLSGTQALPLRTLTASYGTASVPIAKQNINGRLYFLMSATLNGVARSGLWSIGKNAFNSFAISHERPVDNDSTTSNIVLKSFYIVGDYTFISYTENGTYKLNKTNNAASYTISAIYQTIKIDMGDPTVVKKLKGVSVSTEPLPSGASYTLKLHTDSDNNNTWYSVFTEATQNSISHDAINFETTGETLPEGKEFQFEIDSFNGAVITGLEGVFEVISKKLY